MEAARMMNAAERQVSAAAGSGSEARADAVSGRLHTLVRSALATVPGSSPLRPSLQSSYHCANPLWLSTKRPYGATDSYAAKMVSWYDTAYLLRLGRVDHHEIVAVRHLHLRQRLCIHHVLGPDDAVEVQEVRRHGVDLLVG